MTSTIAQAHEAAGTTAAPLEPSLRATGVTVTYGSVEALSDVTLELPAGTSTALIGPNGSGKTTLLHVLAGLVSPTAGTVTTPDVVAYMPQQTGQQCWMPLTVAEVIRMGRYRYRGALRRLVASDRRSVRLAAERLEVANLLGRQFGELSTGQRRRVLFAQAITQEAGMLLLDEPITGLDMASQTRILEVIDDERDRGVIVILSTHHLDEARHCDHVLLMANRLVAQGPPEAILTTEILQASYEGRLVHTGDDCEHPEERLVVLDEHGHGHGDGLAHDHGAHVHAHD